MKHKGKTIKTKRQDKQQKGKKTKDRKTRKTRQATTYIKKTVPEEKRKSAKAAACTQETATFACLRASGRARAPRRAVPPPANPHSGGVGEGELAPGTSHVSFTLITKL